MAENEDREARLPRRKPGAVPGTSAVGGRPPRAAPAAGVPAPAESRTTVRFEGTAPWLRGVYRALRRFRWVAGVVVPWAIIGYLELTSPEVYEPVTMILAALLFILTLPLGLVLRIDSFLEWAHFEQAETALILILPIVLANFVLIGAAKGYLGSKAAGRETGRK